MSNASKSFTSMQATRSHRRDVNGMVGQRSTFNQMRTFLREICVPLQPADPLKSTASAALQNGLMFQPHSESTSFTSWGASASGACVNRPSEARPLVRVQLSPPLGALVDQGLHSFCPSAELSAAALLGWLKQGFTFPAVNRSPFW